MGFIINNDDTLYSSYKEHYRIPNNIFHRTLNTKRKVMDNVVSDINKRLSDMKKNAKVAGKGGD